MSKLQILPIKTTAEVMQTMTTMWRWCLCCLLAVSPAFADEPTAPTSPELYQAKVFKAPQPESPELKYRLMIPDGYEAAADTRFPLVLFLHGAGNGERTIDGSSSTERLSSQNPNTAKNTHASWPHHSVHPAAGGAIRWNLSWNS